MENKDQKKKLGKLMERVNGVKLNEYRVLSTNMVYKDNKFLLKDLLQTMAKNYGVNEEDAKNVLIEVLKKWQWFESEKE